MPRYIPTPAEIQRRTISNMVEFAKSGKSGIFANQSKVREHRRK